MWDWKLLFTNKGNDDTVQKALASFDMPDCLSCFSLSKFDLKIFQIGTDGIEMFCDAVHM
jgi:hypothetical protein